MGMVALVLREKHIKPIVRRGWFLRGSYARESGFFTDVITADV